MYHFHNLEGVNNGEDASVAFWKMKSLSREEQEKIRKELLKYCGLDTYAMVKIWNRFMEVIGGL